MSEWSRHIAERGEEPTGDDRAVVERIDAARSAVASLPNTRARAETLFPIFGALARCRSLVNIGEQLREGWDWWVKLAHDLGITELSVLDIWGPNIESLEVIGGWTRLYLCDVLGAEAARVEQADVVLWWHGPEHVVAKDVPLALRALDAAFQPRVIILGMPWGKHDNSDHVFENPSSYHVSTWYQTDVEALGYTVVTCGRMNTQGGHMTAWRFTGR